MDQKILRTNVRRNTCSQLGEFISLAWDVHNYNRLNTFSRQLEWLIDVRYLCSKPAVSDKTVEILHCIT